MHLDTKLNFQEHLDSVMSKVDKTIGLLRKLQSVLLCFSLVTIYKAFEKDIIYDQAYKEQFNQKLESKHYYVALTITGAIRGTSREKHYQELVLESLQKRRWYIKLCYFFQNM